MACLQSLHWCIVLLCWRRTMDRGRCSRIRTVLLDPQSVAGLPVVLTELRWRGYGPMVKCMMSILSSLSGVDVDIKKVEQ